MTKWGKEIAVERLRQAAWIIEARFLSGQSERLKGEVRAFRTSHDSGDVDTLSEALNIVVSAYRKGLLVTASRDLAVLLDHLATRPVYSPLQFLKGVARSLQFEDLGDLGALGTAQAILNTSEDECEILMVPSVCRAIAKVLERLPSTSDWKPPVRRRPYDNLERDHWMYQRYTDPDNRWSLSRIATELRGIAKDRGWEPFAKGPAEKNSVRRGIAAYCKYAGISYPKTEDR